MHQPVVEVRNMIRSSSSGGRGSSLRIPFEKIARDVLIKGYQLSLVLCDDSLARKINRTYRKKDYAANVLSFPLDAHEGEIFLNIEAAEREAKRFSVSLRSHLMLLFVHGCLHLKGLGHGVAMENSEERTLKKFA